MWPGAGKGDVILPESKAGEERLARRGGAGRG